MRQNRIWDVYTGNYRDGQRIKGPDMVRGRREYYQMARVVIRDGLDELTSRGKRGNQDWSNTVDG
jgi:hypothetical protein